MVRLGMSNSGHPRSARYQTVIEPADRTPRSRRTDSRRRIRSHRASRQSPNLTDAVEEVTQKACLVPVATALNAGRRLILLGRAASTLLSCDTLARRR